MKLYSDAIPGRGATVGRGRAGLTLAELVIVIAILAVLAALLIPQLDNLWRPAQTAAEADTIGQLMNNFAFYQTRTGNWPNQLDSLLADGGTTGYSLVSKDLFGGKQKLTIAAIADDTSGKWFSSLKKGWDAGGGVFKVMWHDATTTPPSNSGTILHTFVTGESLPTLNAGSVEGAKRIAAIFPGGLPTTTRLVVLGVGPSNTAIGTSMAAAPVSPHPEDYIYYRRYLAVFAIYSDGSRARLKAILDRHGDHLDDTLRKYQEEFNPH